MKLTPRMKKWIIQSTIFWGVFCITILIISVLFVYPRITTINEKKQELAEIYLQYNTSMKSWIQFTDFKSLVRNGQESNYTKELLKNVSEEFYKQHFSNTELPSYSVFLEDLENKILEEKTSSGYLNREQSLATILPTYKAKSNVSSTIFWDNENTNLSQQSETLTDFYFINYIENLLYSFNLSFKWDVWVWKLGNVDDKNTQTPEERDLLDENIYSIPLSFNIVGRKADIVDFLHYFQNVARIEISENDFKVLNDDFISRTIEGDNQWENYNIYENQLADVVSISISEYPNSSIKTTPSLVYAMKTIQWKERFEMDVEIHFYVAGVPGYKMQAYVNDLLDSYALFSSTLEKETQKYVVQKSNYVTSEELSAIQWLQNLNTLIVEFEKDMVALRKENAQWKNIENTFNTASAYSKQLEKIKSMYDMHIKILTK